MSPPTEEITGLLQEWREGKTDALPRLMSTVYTELHRIAERQLHREREDHTLQPTALVHEAYLRLLEHRNPEWRDRAHFFGSVASLMRRILVDYARRRRAAKRNAGNLRASVDGGRGPQVDDFDDWVALDEALTRLEVLSARQARVVELRYFGGLTVEETARYMGISTDRVERDWTVARAWLLRELGG